MLGPGEPGPGEPEPGEPEPGEPEPGVLGPVVPEPVVPEPVVPEPGEPEPVVLPEMLAAPSAAVPGAGAVQGLGVFGWVHWDCWTWYTSSYAERYGQNHLGCFAHCSDCRILPLWGKVITLSIVCIVGIVWGLSGSGNFKARKDSMRSVSLASSFHAVEKDRCRTRLRFYLLGWASRYSLKPLHLSMMDEYLMCGQVSPALSISAQMTSTMSFAHSLLFLMMLGFTW